MYKQKKGCGIKGGGLVQPYVIHGQWLTIVIRHGITIQEQTNRIKLHGDSLAMTGGCGLTLKDSG